MEKGFEILQNAVNASIDSLNFLAQETTGINGLLLNSVRETLKAQKTVIEYLSCRLEHEKAVKSRALTFICKKCLMNEFNNNK